MALERRGKSLWFVEELYTNKFYGFAVKKILTRKKTAFQRLMVLETADFGRVLVLDNIVQTSSLREISAPYREMLVHVPMLVHPNPKKVLVIGGGDFEVAAEVLKHPSVERVDLVEIDPQVSEATIKFMPELTGSAEKDGRFKTYYEDGAAFLQRKRSGSYDAVIVDSSDPIGPARSLFTSKFTRNLHRVLEADGIISRQVGNLVYQPSEAPSNFRCMEEVFAKATVYHTVVPIYWGGEFGLVLGFKNAKLFDISQDLAEIQKRFSDRNIETFYYSPQKHVASFTLPKYMEERLRTIYGWSAHLEIVGCDLDTISSKEKCEEFIHKLCRVIGMKEYGPFRFSDFGHAKSATAGPSFDQWIETSSLVAHVSVYWGNVYFELFTCAPCDFQKAVCFARKFFEARKVYGPLLERGSLRNEQEDEVHEISKLKCISEKCVFCRK